MIDKIRQRFLSNRMRAFKACFLGEDAKTPSLEGKAVLGDLRAFARMDRHSFLRDLGGRIDPLSMARIEGRREAVRRIEQFLTLEEHQLRGLVEVDNDASR